MNLIAIYISLIVAGMPLVIAYLIKRQIKRQNAQMLAQQKLKQQELQAQQSRLQAQHNMCHKELDAMIAYLSDYQMTAAAQADFDDLEVRKARLVHLKSQIVEGQYFGLTMFLYPCSRLRESETETKYHRNRINDLLHQATMGLSSGKLISGS